MAFRRRYRRRKLYGRKRTYRRAMYRSRGLRRRRIGRRRTYRNKLWTRKNNVGIRRLKYVDTGFRFRGSGMHMIQYNATASHAGQLTRWNDYMDLNSPFRYMAKVRCTAGHEIYPTGMLEKSLLFKEYRCNGGKIKITVLNQNLFGCFVYYRLGVITADGAVNDYTLFQDLESNDLDHGHGLMKKWIGPGTVLNDGTTELPATLKIVQRWKTRGLLANTGAGMNDMWRAFTYPNETWNTAADDCTPLKNSGGTDYNQPRLIFMWCLVPGVKPTGSGTWTHNTFEADQRRIHIEYHVRSYCQYRKPREHDPNTTTNDLDYGDGYDVHDPTHWDEFQS